MKEQLKKLQWRFIIMLAFISSGILLLDFYTLEFIGDRETLIFLALWIVFAMIFKVNNPSLTLAAVGVFYALFSVIISVTRGVIIAGWIFDPAEAVIVLILIIGNALLGTVAGLVVLGLRRIMHSATNR